MTHPCGCELDHHKIIKWDAGTGMIRHFCPNCGKDISPNTLDKIYPKGSRIYLASPYTHSSPEIRDYRYEMVLYVTAMLIKDGFIVYSPITYTHTLATRYNIQPDNSDWWVDFDQSFIENWANVLIVLELLGYENSSGIKREITMAEKAGIPITYISMENLYDISRSGFIKLDR